MAAADETRSGEMRPFRVLSIDGGGMRGVYTAAYLDKLARAFAQKRSCSALDIGASFDLLVGTSTGAIVACALAAGIGPDRVLALYERYGGSIFRQRLPSSWPRLLWGLLGRAGALKAGDAALREALEGAFGAETVVQVYRRRRIALCVTAVEMSQHRSWVFKTPHFPSSYQRDNDYTLAQVCLASSAAPLFRSLAQLGNTDGSGSRTFADGGLWANNPVMVALVEALQLLAGEPARPLEIFSLGTCPKPSGTPVRQEDVHWGPLRWRFGALATTLSLDAQEFAFDNMASLLARHVGRGCSITRFPRGPVPAALHEYLDLDDARPEAIRALVHQATADVDVTTSACARPEHREGQAIARLFETMSEYGGQ